MAVRSIIGPPVPGTRPGLHAQTLISTGQPDLDRILGGGLPLGSVFCILEDSLSQHHNTLLRYFIAEGLACGHQVFCASDNQEATTLSENLPQTVQPRSQPDEVAKLDEDNDSGLKIAWQYRRYLQDKQKVSTQQARKKSSAFQRKDGKSSAPKNDGIKDWCHEFDIARPLKDGAATQNLDSRSYGGDTAIQSMLNDIQIWTEANSGPGDTKLKANLSSPEVDHSVLPRNDPQNLETKQNSRTIRPLMSSIGRTSEVGQGEAAVQSIGNGETNQSQRSQLISDRQNPENLSQGARQSLFSDQGKLESSGVKSSDLEESIRGLQPERKSAFKPRLKSSMARPHTDQNNSSPPLQEGINSWRETKTNEDLAALKLSDNQQGLMQASSNIGAEIKRNAISNLVVRRIAVQSLGSPSWASQGSERESNANVLKTVHTLKKIARSSQSAIMISIPSDLHGDEFAVRLRHICDGTITLTSVQDDSQILKLISDPNSCVGTFTVDRLPAINTLSPPMPTNRLHIIRHKRRKLTIHPFEVDPDAEAALVEAESSPGNSSTASLLCGGPPKNDNKIYDF